MIAGTTSVVVKGDGKRLEDLLGLVDFLSSQEIRIGFLEGQGGDDQHKDRDGDASELTVAEVAERNEFGSETSPSRPFMRMTADTEKGRIAEAGKRLVVQALDGKNAPGQVLDKLGAFVEGKVKRTIQSNMPPPNSPDTIEAKGSDHTLIDTGQMVQSVRYGVYPAGGGK